MPKSKQTATKETSEKIQHQAQLLKALGDSTRLQIFCMLAKCAKPLALSARGDVRPMRGATAGQVCCHVTGEDTINSRISFHLKELKRAGLINVERHGKHQICSVQKSVLEELGNLIKSFSGKKSN